MKKLLAILTAITVIASLTGCNGTTESEASVATTANDTTVSGEATQAPEDTADTAADTTADAVDTTAEPAETEPEVKDDAPYVLGGELTPTMIKDSVLIKGNQVRLASVMKKLANGEEVTVGYLGGSITAGSGAAADTCYARLTTDWLEEKFPDAKINYVNAGIGATGSYIGVHRVDAQLLSQNPDLVFIDFSVNDTNDKNELNTKTYDSLLRKIWTASSNPAIITIAMTMEDGTSVQECHSAVAAAYDIPMISYHDSILGAIDKDYIKWTDISNDNIHPNVPGHAILSQMLTNYMQTVIDNKDSISGDESDFSKVAFSDAYIDAKLIDHTNVTPSSLGTFDTSADVNFGGFMGFWRAKSASDGKFTENPALTIDVTAKNIGILYSKMVNRGTRAEVRVDGELVKTLDGTFPNGWGNYAEFEELISFDEIGTHTVEITPIEGSSLVAFYVTALAVS